MDSVPTGPGAGPSAARSLERGMCRRQAGTGMSVSPPGKGARPRDVAGAWPVLRRGPATRPGADRAGPAGAGDRLALTVGAGAMTGIVFRGALAWATPLPPGVLCPAARTRASRASRRWAPSAAPSGRRTARSASCRGIRLPPGPVPRGADLVPGGRTRAREGGKPRRGQDVCSPDKRIAGTWPGRHVWSQETIRVSTRAPRGYPTWQDRWQSKLQNSRLCNMVRTGSCGGRGARPTRSRATASRP